MTSPTQRSLAYARKQGWTAQVVERWNPHARVRHDLFGCIDLIVCTGRQIIGVQACADSSHAARYAKAMEQPGLKVWLESGGEFEVWSWAKQGPRGKRKLWTLRTQTIGVASLAAWASVQPTSLTPSAPPLPGQAAATAAASP